MRTIGNHSRQHAPDGMRANSRLMNHSGRRGKQVDRGADVPPGEMNGWDRQEELLTTLTTSGTFFPGWKVCALKGCKEVANRCPGSVILVRRRLSFSSPGHLTPEHFQTRRATVAQQGFLQLPHTRNIFPWAQTPDPSGTFAIFGTRITPRPPETTTWHATG